MPIVSNYLTDFPVTEISLTNLNFSGAATNTLDFAFPVGVAQPSQATYLLPDDGTANALKWTAPIIKSGIPAPVNPSLAFEVPFNKLSGTSSVVGDNVSVLLFAQLYGMIRIQPASVISPTLPKKFSVSIGSFDLSRWTAPNYFLYKEVIADKSFFQSPLPYYNVPLTVGLGQPIFAPTGEKALSLSLTAIWKEKVVFVDDTVTSTYLIENFYGKYVSGACLQIEAWGETDAGTANDYDLECDASSGVLLRVGMLGWDNTSAWPF